MTTEEFNALPLEARRFIEANSNCLGCGDKESKLDQGYKNYLNTKKMRAFQLFGGGVNYTYKENSGVLYHIDAKDTDDEIRKKIKIAKLIYKKNPELFIEYNENEMEGVLKGLKKPKVIDLKDDDDDEPKK